MNNLKASGQAAGCAQIVIASVLVLVIVLADMCWAELLPGTVLVSRNIDERENTSPGYWNHLALYAGNGIVIESQVGRGVIRTPFDEYMARPYSRILAMEPRDPIVGLRMVAEAQTRIGLPFRQLSSLRGRDTEFSMARGMNCDSVVRDAMFKSTGRRDLRKLKIPDRIFLYD